MMGLKRESIMMPKPRSAFLSVQCGKCGAKAVVFSHTTTDVSCKSCGELLAERSGSKATILGKVLGALDQ
ncbi:MAG: 30S ribosomal protein S27e, partial [Nitrososphaera sp.]